METSNLSIPNKSKSRIPSYAPPIPIKSRRRGMVRVDTHMTREQSSPRSSCSDWSSRLSSSPDRYASRLQRKSADVGSLLSSRSSVMNYSEPDSPTRGLGDDEEDSSIHRHDEAVRQYRRISQNRRFHRQSALDALQRMSFVGAFADDDTSSAPATDDERHSRNSSVDASWIDMVMSEL